MYGDDPLSLEKTIPEAEQRRMEAARGWIRWFRRGACVFFALAAATGILALRTAE